jgi:FtsP/CotA-like multicopper oxidase with cupredoxin domain
VTFLVLAAPPLTARGPIVDGTVGLGQANPEGRTAQSIPLPRAEPNDQCTPAGRIVDGVLRLELEALEAEWYPRGPDGPRVVTLAFAEVGGPPQVPGPLVRTAANTPIHVTIRNSLSHPIAVRGLSDRAATSEVPAAAATGLPAFAFSEPVVVPPGESREARFTPAEPVSSFYYAQAVPPGSDGSGSPFGALEEGAFMGSLIVDPADGEPPPDERVLMITRWGSPAEPGMGISWKMMLNGRSWPFTERLEYTVGDSVRWRVINASAVGHPMHLHGFYFTVDAVGDTQADTTHAPTARPLAVTQMMEEFSSLRLTWVPEEPGNWLFHCHLIRHMGELQRFQVEREAPERAGHGHDMEGMAGLVTGITIYPAPGHEAGHEVAERRLDLWTGQRPGIYGGKPELGFVVQEGAAVPAPDSTRVPGSPLMLTRGEPTEIVVHNRLAFPLSVHWHGLELASLYDGVGGWSGHPGGTRPPIVPGDSVRVFITPPRAGTFMYHTHGEPEHELSQGLYGPFLVLEPGEERDPDADRIFLLGARGAERDAIPAINGVAWPAPERFQVGRTYRLRFLHISPDAFKRVRLLENGEPVRWRRIAKDGADLPEGARQLEPAVLRIGVGETYDVEWTPEGLGVHALEVTTEFYPSIGGSVTQRIAFGVGDVDEADLVLAPAVERPFVELSAEDRARYTGTFFLGRPPGAEADPFEAEADPFELILRVWEEGGRLHSTGVQLRGEEDTGATQVLFPLGEHAFESGRDLEGLIHLMQGRYRFIADDGVFDRLELEFEGGFTLMLERVSDSELNP